MIDDHQLVALASFKAIKFLQAITIKIIIYYLSRDAISVKMTNTILYKLNLAATAFAVIIDGIIIF